MSVTQSLPFLFTFPHVIAGKGFFARVEVHGRALLKEEAEGAETWFYGAFPGTVAGGGKDYTEACKEFRKAYLSVLFDVANEADSFEAFEREARELLDVANESVTDEWNECLRAVRENPSLKKEFSWVPAESRPPAVMVTKLDQRSAEPTLNQFEEFQAVSKAA